MNPQCHQLLRGQCLFYVLQNLKQVHYLLVRRTEMAGLEEMTMQNRYNIDL